MASPRTKSRTNKRRKAPTSLKLLHNRKNLRLALFAMTFALVGVWYLVFTQAAATYTVRFVLFCAQDACSGSTSDVDAQAKEIQAWYQSKIGKAFVRTSTVKITGRYNARYYGKDVRYNTSDAWRRINPEVRQSNVKTVVMMGFRALSNCGVGETNGLVAIADPIYGCSTRKSSVLAHELGHTLLSTVGHTSDGTLMHAPYACNGKLLRDCQINSSQRSEISNNAWFNNSTSSSTSSNRLPVTSLRSTTSKSSSNFICRKLYGAAYDPDSISQSVNIHLYIDGKKMPTFSTTASNQIYQYFIPINYHDNRSHRFVAYAIDRQDASKHTKIGDLTATCPQPIGNVETLTCRDVTGWAVDPSNTRRNVEIHIYFSKLDGSGKKGYPGIFTNIKRSDVNTYIKNLGYHYNSEATPGFAFRVPTEWRGIHHRTEVYAINNSTQPLLEYNSKCY